MIKEAKYHIYLINVKNVNQNIKNLIKKSMTQSMLKNIDKIIKTKSNSGIELDTRNVKKDGKIS